MIKAPQRAALGATDFHFITAITKAQIDGLIAAGVLQVDLFETLAEVDGRGRPALRLSAQSGARRGMGSLATGQAGEPSKPPPKRPNAYLREHPRAAAKTQIARLKARAETLNIDKFVGVAEQDRRVVVTADEAALSEAARLDGCYALRTDLLKTLVAKEIVHDRYKDLAHVEWAFRDSKSVQLEMRPVYLRDENRTRGHALVIMLAYLMARELRRRWRDIDLTMQRPRPSGRPMPHRSDHRRPALLPSSPDATRRRAPIIRSRRGRHPHRAAPRPSPSSH